MKGQALRLAKEAAIAAAEVLHPEDRIGVVAFNDEPDADRPDDEGGRTSSDIEDKISRAGRRGPHRLRARRSTRRARSSGRRTLQIKHCIFLTDGHNNWPGAILARVETMAREGVTLSTVGAGLDVDVNQLSEMAAARTRQVHPGVLGGADPADHHDRGRARRDEQRRAAPVRDRGEGRRAADAAAARAARSRIRPKRERCPPEEAPRIATPVRAAWPAAYLKGIHPELDAGHLRVAQASIAPPHAWVSLATKGGDPIAIHTYAGFGRLVALTVPMQGDAAGPLVNWDDYANFTSQVVRFLTPATRPERLQLRIDAAGRAARLEVVDVERKPGIDERLRFAFRDQRARPGRRRACAAPGPARSTSRSRPTSAPRSSTSPRRSRARPDPGRASFAVGRPPEIERARGRTSRASSGGPQALHGGSPRDAAEDPRPSPRSETVERRPASLVVARAPAPAVPAGPRPQARGSGELRP